MPFARHLDPGFIAALNQLHEDKSSWWHTLTNDPDVFLAVRENAINAYVNGGSIGRIQWAGQKVHLQVNRAYLVFPAPKTKTDKSNYVDLLASSEPPKAIVISDPSAFVAHLKNIKDIVWTYFGRERQGENEIAVRQKEVIDIEAAFDTVVEDGKSEFEGDDLRQGRIDLVAVSGDGQIVFTEAKVLKNRELISRSSRTPSVCDQLILYHQWIKAHKSEIQAAYSGLRNVYQHLHGSFFDHRFSKADAVLTVDLIPRLLVYDFDGHQEKGTPPIRQSVCDGVVEAISGFTKDHIRFVGKTKNVTPAHLL
jgi:hypothetical protein